MVVCCPPYFHAPAEDFMKIPLFAAALAGLALATAFAQSPMDGLKSKMKPGMYAYKMEMEMPGMPAGAARQPFTFQHCVTPHDMEKGQLGKGREGKGPENCEMQNFKMSGNTASYRMVCKGENPMTADNEITFVSDGFNMNMRMAMDRGGQKMSMTQHMEGRYLGPCTK
jgi:hypothetical protein